MPMCHPYVISSTLYISYHVQLSFCTFSAQMHIVHVICMLSVHVHIICLSSLPLLIYLIIHNLVSAHCLHTCILLMSSVYYLNAYVMYMSSLLLLSVYAHVIYILSGHICIMCTLSEVVLDIFLPNRQYQCHPYIISSSLSIFYHGEYVIPTPSGWCVICTPSRWCVICTPSGWHVIHTSSRWHVICTPKKHVLPLWSLRSK